MGNELDHVGSFNRSIGRFFGKAVRLSLKDPSMAAFLSKTVWCQKRAARVRLSWEKRGVHVPPIMVASITKRCNPRSCGQFGRTVASGARPREAARFGRNASGLVPYLILS